ncbi:MAG: SpoIIE family protein phosphatase [Anaerolineae bacterium]
MPNKRAAEFIECAYKCLVGTAGWTVLVLINIAHPGAANPLEIAFFILISAASKRLGIQVVQGGTLSLVGVIDLATLFIFGAPVAAVVAVVSNVIFHLSNISSLRIGIIGHRLLMAFFNSGLNALNVLATATVYRSVGGVVPLVQVSWPAMLPVLAACVCWFAIDHLGWALTQIPMSGFAGAKRFIQDIIRSSLLLELVPLPLAVLIASAYLNLSTPLVILLTLLFLGIAIIARRMMTTLNLERRHAREQSVLSEMGRRFLQADLRLDPVCRLIGEYCGRIVPAPVYVILLDCTDWDCSVLPMVIIEGLMSEAYQGELSDAPQTWLNANRRPILVGNFSDNPPFKPFAITGTTRSGLYVPILLESEVIGSLSAESPEVSAFTVEDLKALQMVAFQAALGLRGARLYRNEQERTSQLTAISQVSRKVAAILDLNTLFADTVTLIREAFGYYCVNLFISDESSRQVQFQASSSPVIQQRGIEIGWGQGIIGRVASSGESVLANDVRQDERFLADSGIVDTRAELAIPLKVEQRILGVLDLQSDRMNAFSRQDADVLQTLADQIAIAIEDSRIYQAQQEQTWVSTALLQVADAVADLTTAEEILESVARLTVMLAGVHCCLVLLWSEEEQVFTAVESAGLNPRQAQALKNQRFGRDAVPLLAQVREEGQAVHGHVEDLTRYLPPPAGQLDRCDEMLALPLRAQGYINGVMLVSEPIGEARLAAHRQSILIGIANHTAMALNNAHLYAAQRDETWISTALLQVANTISSVRSLEDIMATVVRLTPFLAGIDWSAILLWDAEKRALFVARTYGLEHKVRDTLEGRYLPAALLQLDTSSFSINQPIELDLSRIENIAAMSGTPTAWALRSPDRFLGALVVGTELGSALNRRRATILAGIANQTSIAIETYQLYQQTLDQQRLQRSLELAHDIQQGFLPESCPQIAGWDIAAEWRAARGVGGDYYDFIQLDATHTGLVIGDVSDKGIAAALYMALSRAVVRAAALGMLGPAETLNRANRILMEDSRSSMFISLFYAILDTRNGQMKYARAGHNPPLVLRASDSSLIALESAGTVLGIVGDPHVAQETVDLAPGDLLVMYTDGVTEAINELDEEFGEERLRQIIVHAAELNAQQIVERINAAVRIHCGEREQFDDFTVVVVKRSVTLG